MSDMPNIGDGVKASAIFTPSAAAYGAGALIEAPKLFSFTNSRGEPVPNGSIIRVMSAVLKIDQTALIASEGAYSLAMYSATPPSAQADKAVWTLASADLPYYRGTLGLGTPVDLGAACYVKTQFTDQQDFLLSTQGLYGVLIQAGAPTFTAVAREVFLYGILI